MGTKIHRCFIQDAVVKDSEGYSTLVEGLPAVIFVNENEVDLSYTVKEVTDIPGFTGTITLRPAVLYGIV